MVAAVDENGQLVLDKTALAAVGMAEQNAPAAVVAVAVETQQHGLAKDHGSSVLVECYFLDVAEVPVEDC